MNLYDRARAEALGRADRLGEFLVDDEVGPEPDEVRPAFRRMRVAAHPPPLASAPTLSPEATRARMVAALDAYMAEPDPAEVLLLRAMAGVGKTTLAVVLADRLIERDEYVALAVPRHRMFQTITAESRLPDRYWDVLGRREATDTDPEPTCKFPAGVALGVERGIQAVQICLNLRDCGRAYMDDGCRWWGQWPAIRAGGYRGLVIQHQHVFLGLPELQTKVRLLVIDENPIGAVPWLRRVPVERIVPQQGTNDAAMDELLERIHALVLRDQTASGPTLLALLGGAATVLAVCRDAAEVPAPRLRPLRQINDVVNRDYVYHQDLARLLVAEAEAALRGQDYPPRVEVGAYAGEEGLGGKGLTLYLRRRPLWRADALTGGWGPHAVCLDYTGDARYYERVLGRPVRVVAPETVVHQRVFQVVDRANGIGALLHRSRGLRRGGDGALLAAWEKGHLTAHGAQLVEQVALVARDYRARGKVVGIITLAAFETHLLDLASEDEHGQRLIAHYGAARGTNDFRAVDCLILAGTPCPPPGALYDLARCVLDDRMDPMVDAQHEAARTPVWRLFAHADAAGRRYEIPTPVFADPDLAALEWQLIDAEMLQAAARGRPALRAPDDPAHVWLLCNRPLELLRVDALVSIRDLLGAPGGVDRWAWGRVVEVADAHLAAQRALTSTELAAAVGVDASTAGRYVEALARAHPEDWRLPEPGERVALPTRRGRPPRVILPARILDLDTLLEGRPG